MKSNPMIDGNDVSESTCSRKNDDAWSRIFKEFHILDVVDSGKLFEISSSELSAVGKREPRLMAFFGSRHEVPILFQKNNLGILPTERGKYVIGHFDTFHDLEYGGDVPVNNMPIQPKLDTLPTNKITKEPAAILSAFNYGILDKVVGLEKGTLKLTNYGKESASSFSFNINGFSGFGPYEIMVDNAQMETDGIFESENVIVNVEAKIGYRVDFVTRQLYYPFRKIRECSNKQVLNVLLTYSQDVLYVHCYEFTNTHNYNSLKLLSLSEFSFIEPIRIDEVIEIVNNTKTCAEPNNIPFPQANSIERIVEIVHLVSKNPRLTDSEIGQMMGMDARQGGYYANACCYLGLLNRDRGSKQSIYNTISHDGKLFLGLKGKERKLELIKLICRHKIFSDMLMRYFEDLSLPEQSEIEDYMIDYNILSHNSSTLSRRVSTVNSWIQWIVNSISMI